MKNKLIGNITDPDPIASETDVKVLNPIAPGVCCCKESRGSADPFDGNLFHQPSDASMTDGVLLTQE